MILENLSLTIFYVLQEFLSTHQLMIIYYQKAVIFTIKPYFDRFQPPNFVNCPHFYRFQTANSDKFQTLYSFQIPILPYTLTSFRFQITKYEKCPTLYRLETASFDKFPTLYKFGTPNFYECPSLYCCWTLIFFFVYIDSKLQNLPNAYSCRFHTPNFRKCTPLDMLPKAKSELS